MRRRFETCLVLVAAAACALGAADQETIHAGPVYTSLTVFPEVKVLVSVPPTAKPESLTPGLFSLKVDNGVALPGKAVQSLADTGFGMAAVVMLDVSGSMLGGPLNAIRAGLVKFASQATTGDRVAICTVADETRWDVNWNDSPDQVKVALAGLRSRGSLTRLWDGLLDAVGRYPESPTARRLIVISDGHDEGSQHTLDEVIAAAGSQHVVVDSVGMTRSDPKYLAYLARLSSATGGLHRAALSLTMLEQLVGDGIKRYRGMPVVTFNADGVTADGKPRAFLVSWKGSGAELQSQLDSAVPEDPKVTASSTGAGPSVNPPASPSAETGAAAGISAVRRTFESIPKLWLYVGAGMAVALVLGLIALLLFRGRKVRGGAQPARHVETPMQPPPPPTFPPSGFQPPPPQQFSTGTFGQTPPPVSMPGSVYMPFVPEREPEPPPPATPQSTFPAPSKLQPSAWLVGVEGPAAGRSFPIDEPQFWIGANPNNHVQLADDPTVSGNHACIAYEDDTLGVYDHRSTNGLFLNGERVPEVRSVLKPGDKLRVGRSVFVLQPASGNRLT